MKKKGKIGFEIFDQIKNKKAQEISHRSKKPNKKPTKKRITEDRIVVEIAEEKSKYYIKHINLRKKKLRKLQSFILAGVFLLMAVTIVFLFNKYREFQYYLSENEQVVAQSNKYLELQKMKADELRSLKDLTLENINNLPEERKNLMLNLIPSGNPLTKEIHITSPFGTRTHPISGGTKDHKGIDMRLEIGDDVIAPAMGKISFAGEKNGYGNTIIIDHPFGFQTLYAHLDQIYVKEGEMVGKGKVIAAGGNTGKSTGPHLHYEILYNDTPVEPENFMNWDKSNFNILFNNEKNVQWEYFLTIMGKN